MKNVILLKMKLWAFLTEIPLIVLLVICKNNTDKVDKPLGLWPLMIALGALIVFLAFYFFRLVVISWEEIRDIGLYTRRDSAVINEGTALSVTVTPKGMLKLILFGPVGSEAIFDWTNDEDRGGKIALYRGYAYGGRRGAAKLLTYFGAAEEDLELLLGKDEISRKYQYSSVTSRSTDVGREIIIDITETLLANGTPMKKPSKSDGDNE